MTRTAMFHVRSVGFRAGTDEELTALHDVEAPVAAERGSHRKPDPLESYIAFAGNLPSQFKGKRRATTYLLVGPREHEREARDVPATK